MLFRSYKFSLKLNNKQEVVFKNLLKYSYVTYQQISPHMDPETPLSINQLRSITTPLFEKYSFTPLFTEILFPQILTNLQKKSAYFETIFPFTFKQFTYNKNNNQISLSFCKNIQLSHYRKLPSKIYKVELYYKNKKWYINLLVSKKEPKKRTEHLRTIGVDVGLKSFAFLSNGKSIENPRFYDEMKEKLSIEQHKLSKKQKGSKKWLEQKKKVNRLYTKLHRQRLDFLHKFTHYLTENFDVIGIENIHIRDLQQKRHLRNSLSDVSWGEFMEMLAYKCEEKGKHLVFVERFFPSSQICSSCGSRKWMPVHIRTYSCSNCNVEQDRDFNASLNIENRAKQIYLETIYMA